MRQLLGRAASDGTAEKFVSLKQGRFFATAIAFLGKFVRTSCSAYSFRSSYANIKTKLAKIWSISMAAKKKSSSANPLAAAKKKLVELTKESEKIRKESQKIKAKLDKTKVRLAKKKDMIVKAKERLAKAMLKAKPAGKVTKKKARKKK